MKSIAKSIVVTLSVLLLFSLFSLNSLAAQTTPSVKLSKSSATIGRGESINIYSFITDADKAKNEYTYASSNNGVATVNDKGVVKGNSIGTATITVTLHVYETIIVYDDVTDPTDPTEPTDPTDPTEPTEPTEPPKPREEVIEKTYTAVFKVTVKNAPTKVKMNYHRIALALNKSFKLKATVSGGYSYSNKFVSSNKDIAEVDSKGVVKAHKTGTVVIAYKTFNNVKDSCVIKVTKNPSKLVITTKNIKVQKGSNVHKISYRFASGGVSSLVSFKSSNNAVFRVNQKGYVTGIKKGKATLTLKTPYENVFVTQKLQVIDIALPLNRNSTQLALDRINVVRQVYGKSAQGRPLEGYIITNIKTGKYKKTLFIDFSVHGFEDSYAKDGKKLTEEANRIITYYANHSQELGIYRLVIVPCANPDGTIAGRNNYRACKSAFGRCTAKHIDMNRDFGPFKATESRKLKNYIKKCAPKVYLNMHGWLNETLGTKKLSKIINRAQGFKKFINSYGEKDNYIIAWVHKKLKIPAALVEYKAPNKISLTRDVKMIRGIIKAY